MADIVDAATRSRMMSGIRSRNTKPEKLVRSFLHRHGFRFRLHVRELPGKPDIVLPRYRAVIFVHGCFWHGHNCPIFRMPKTREEFWSRKIARNQANDFRASGGLLLTGWRVGTVWECALRQAEKDTETLLHPLLGWLRGKEQTIEIRS